MVDHGNDCAARQWGCGCAPGKCRSVAYDHILKVPKRLPFLEFLVVVAFWMGVSWMLL